jgi:glycosyltransferase involved in cell wall biosynthesis
MRLTWLFLVFSSLLLASDLPIQRAEPKSMTTSVLIPCTAFHFPWLKSLLESYARQTCLPDEICVSLSECKSLNPEEIKQLEKGNWPFRLHLFCHVENRTAGENRNWARALSKGDLLICQDADDLPHPQRVEIVKYIFEHFEVDHLIHSWAQGGAFTPCDKEMIPLFLSTPLQIFEGFREGDRLIPLHNGNICLSRELAQKVRWDCIPDGQEDVRFNQKAYQITEQTFLTPLGLIHYVEGHSYFRDRER